MTRGHEPGDFIDSREVSEGRAPNAQHPSEKDDPRDQHQEQRGQGSGSRTSPEETRSPEPRKIYEIRGRTYRLRTSEIVAMLEIGKFRTIGLEDLREFAYGGDKDGVRRDVENLFRQGLLQMKSIPHEEKGSRQLMTLTKVGHRLLVQNRFTGKDQALYFGFANPREAHHDADLYRLYQKAADGIERAGGQNLRVVLDFELKKRVYHDLAKLGPDRASSESKRTVVLRHGLQVVSGKIPLPDVRIEYDTPEGNRARADIELVTSNYRLRNLAEKVRAGFSIYAHPNDVSNLQRVLDQRELTAEILSL
jgi:hypothetical protein